MMEYAYAVYPQKCVLCGYCKFFCPQKAFVRDGTGMRILAERCNGCGICRGKCQGQAIYIEKEDFANENPGTVSS